ncbi:MAG: serine/threonine-protein kinase [Gammaproteobacteria bacterium]|jgi:serine/threonine protein kinase
MSSVEEIGMAIPEKLGRYIITKELGRGSTSAVYLCHAQDSKRDVTLKLYFADEKPGSEQDQIRRRLFFNEAHMVGMLNHPNILPIIDSGEEGNSRFIVMEYLRNAQPLSAFCRLDNLLPVRKVVEVIFKCAKALDYAHRKGVVHRDIKPSNILITAGGDVRLVDFGIAYTPRAQHLAPSTGLVGSPSYMSPEVVREGPISGQADLYSLGVVMYELLTGKRPFYGENLSRLVHQIIYASPMPLHRVRPEVPAVLESIVFRALEKDTSRRFKTGLEFAAALTRAFHDLDRMAEEVAEQERFNLVRRLPFFSEFSYPEIWEILNASVWQSHTPGEEIVVEGQVDDSFFLIVTGEVTVLRRGRAVGTLREGDAFGESGFLSETRRTATIMAETGVSVLRVNATLMEQASTDCQLRFYRQFLRSLIERLARTTEDSGASAGQPD